MRKWSWQLGRIAGIAVYVHVSFLLIVGLVVFSHWSMGDNLLGMAAGVGMLLAIFGCVVLHELGHALAARRYGIGTRDIILLPIGGVARLERMPDKPSQELVVALAGPAVNVVIASLLFAYLKVTQSYVPLDRLGMVVGPFFERLMLVNIVLIVFNMIPAFPMDGGRVLRALLGMKLNHLRATQIAVRVGQGMAVLIGAAGLFWVGNPFLLLIAAFVWFGASSELRLSQVRASLAGWPVSRAMITDFRILSPHDPIGRAADLLRMTTQRYFPVIAGESLLGIVHPQDVVTALQTHGENHLVSQVMRTGVRGVRAEQPLEQAFMAMMQAKQPVVAVTRNGFLVGLLTPESVERFTHFHEATQRFQKGSAPWARPIIRDDR